MIVLQGFPKVVLRCDHGTLKEEREQFLAEPHIAALSCTPATSAAADRAHLVPMHGRRALAIDRDGFSQAPAIEAAGHFSLMVERLDPTVRYVAVDGAVADQTRLPTSSSSNDRQYLAPRPKSGRI